MSATSVLTVLTRLIGVPVDPTQLNARAAEMEEAIEGLVKSGKLQNEEELTYIG
jgi:hypothetical protein